MNILDITHEEYCDFRISSIYQLLQASDKIAWYYTFDIYYGCSNWALFVFLYRSAFDLQLNPIFKSTNPIRYLRDE